MSYQNITGERIKVARKAKNWDQEQLAVALDLEAGLSLGQSDISEIERQFRGVKDYELEAIARALDVSPTWLLRGGD